MPHSSRPAHAQRVRRRRRRRGLHSRGTPLLVDRRRRAEVGSGERAGRTGGPPGRGGGRHRDGPAGLAGGRGRPGRAGGASRGSRTRRRRRRRARRSDRGPAHRGGSRRHRARHRRHPGRPGRHHAAVPTADHLDQPDRPGPRPGSRLRGHRPPARGRRAGPARRPDRSSRRPTRRSVPHPPPLAPAPPALGPLGPAPHTPSSEQARRTVTVVRGDSLWSIAARHLGPHATAQQVAREWPRWYAANRRVIGSDPDLIRVGQVLTAPSTGAGS